MLVMERDLLTEYRVVSPGKLVLLGEYAVLDGGSAISLAIHRGVQCAVRLGGDTVRATTPDGDTRFVTPALCDAAPGEYSFSNWNPVDLPGKPGFGGSAAACVAACVAAGRPATDALAIHHAVQRSGSGIDVLTSIHGGMGLFSGRTWTALPPRVPVVVYSGQSAKTGPRVERFLQWDRRQRASFVRDSNDLIAQFATDPLESTRAAYRLLRAATQAAGVDWATPALDELVNLAESAGGAAKPSGAGGGDCVVAFFDDPEAQSSFLRQCIESRFAVIPIDVAGAATRTD